MSSLHALNQTAIRAAFWAKLAEEGKFFPSIAALEY
jgi:hypothetical protein